jgi:mannose-6-phosphate isomerase-like protein (cupin superfamily)
MKIKLMLSLLLVVFFASFANERFTRQLDKGYVLERENEIRVQQPSPHGAAGMTIAYPYFSSVKDYKNVFRKRTLGKGASIGYHLQKTDEIYYIVSGNGIMKMNGETFPVSAGDAVLTRPGNWHGLEPAGDDSLTVIINYQQ